VGVVQEGGAWKVATVDGMPVAQGLGALLFAPPGKQPVPPSQPGTGGLAELLEAAIRFDSGEKLLPASMQRLFAAGSTPGGARPKVLLSDDAGDWIAKFPSPARDHRFDIVGLEKTSLDLAARAGIDVPDSRLISVGARRVLLVRRFDIAGPGRHHMISLQTLCKEAPGRYAMSYSELSEAVRKVSARPQADVGKLYRRMAFNAALGNTDDHLKNFWMIRTVFGYVLSPAIDLLPDVGELHEHVLTFNYERTTPSRSDLRAIARRWNVSAGDADACINEVCKAVSGFADIARAHRVPRSNIDEFTRDVGRRCAQMGKDHM
jgi:serine/threonine-protein kinase HipA